MKINKNFVRIDKVLAQSTKDKSLQEALNRHNVIKFWALVAKGFIDEADIYTKAIDYSKGVLVVACLSSQVAAEIKILTPDIIRALNECLEKQLVFAIHVEI